MPSEIGHLYLLSNAAMSGYVKIGFTRKVEAQLRVDELSANTAVPLPFTLEAAWLVENPSAVEARVHRQLAAHRVARDREFFRFAATDAERKVNEVLYGTGNVIEAAIKQIKEIARLYRQYPQSFKDAEDLICRIEEYMRREV